MEYRVGKLRSYRRPTDHVSVQFATESLTAIHYTILLLLHSVSALFYSSLSQRKSARFSNVDIFVLVFFFFLKYTFWHWNTQELIFLFTVLNVTCSRRQPSLLTTKQLQVVNGQLPALSLSLSLSLSLTHTHTRARAHTHTPQTHTHAHTRMHTRTPPPRHKHMHTHTLTHTHTHTHTHTGGQAGGELCT